MKKNSDVEEGARTELVLEPEQARFVALPAFRGGWDRQSSVLD